MSLKESNSQILIKTEDNKTVPAPSGASAIDPEQWVESYGDYLFRHALLRVSDHAAAEDLVQETFLAAWRGRSAFAGRSSEKTWLLGILKHKIADYHRQNAREKETPDSDILSELEESHFGCSFLGNAHWSRAGAPGPWTTPARTLENSEFWEVLHRCIDKLPQKLGRVFLLREMEESEVEVISKELEISSGNLFVMLHRARLAIRRCLELNWFKSSSQTRQTNRTSH